MAIGFTANAVGVTVLSEMTAWTLVITIGMNAMRNIKRCVKAGVVVAVVSTALAGCYVVPIQPSPYTEAQTRNSVPMAAAPAPRPVYTARLYPTNESAAALGRVSGTITNPERGHGEFSFVLGNERYSGEATREPGSSSGYANASGDRGGYVKCTYTMNSASLGGGTCNFSGGARYDMHISL